MVSASWPAAAALRSTPSSLAPRKHNSQRLQGGRDGSVCTEAHREVVCGCSQNGYFHKCRPNGCYISRPQALRHHPLQGGAVSFRPTAAVLCLFSADVRATLTLIYSEMSNGSPDVRPQGGNKCVRIIPHTPKQQEKNTVS